MDHPIRTNISLSLAPDDVNIRKVRVLINGMEDFSLAQSLSGTTTTFSVVTPHGVQVSVLIVDVNEDGLEGPACSVLFTATDPNIPPAPTATITGSSLA